MFWKYSGGKMNKEIDILSADKLKHYVKGVYSGSHKGMRYFISSVMTDEENENRELLLTIWPEPYNLNATPEENKEYFQFPFTEEGLEELEKQLNETYHSKISFWNERASVSTLFM
jgi:hypothetical protein